MIFFDPQEFLKNCQNGRLLALDVGRVRIGVATTDDARKFSLPSDTINRQGNKKDFPIIKKIIEEKKIKGIIVGLPISFEHRIINFYQKIYRKFSERNKFTNLFSRRKVNIL